MPSTDDPSNAIRSSTILLGFSAVGVTTPSAALAGCGHLEQWIAEGYAAGMDYMRRKPAQRCDATSLLPGCKSVIVVALDCAALEPGQNAPTDGKVARYAQGLDYHKVIYSKLVLLRQLLSQVLPDQHWKICVDTSPVMEKAYAVAAGIGWQGRNTLVLNERHGSFFMLGLLLTTASLPADSPAKNRCGTCNCCIAACPVGALSAPGVLDARKCISYWTTSAKSPPPAGYELHGWRLGCDVCQDACPYNARIIDSWPTTAGN